MPESKISPQLQPSLLPPSSSLSQVGVVAAKAASLAWNKPLVPVHHMEAHALMPLLSNPEVTFPFICLLVSGGHSMLVLVKAVGQYTVLGEARRNLRPHSAIHSSLCRINY